MRLAAALWCWCLALAAGADQAAKEGRSPDVDADPLPDLQRVIVVARHGNRAPNPQIEMLCPTFAAEVLPKFGVAPGALSRVGMAESEENGRFLRERFRDFLPFGRYLYDGTYAFFSERVARNIVSTAAMARGMFPPGSGLEGFAPERPNLVPIATTQKGADVLMNCPRDGPCQHVLAADKEEWARLHARRIFQEHKGLFQKISEACGYPLTPDGIVYKGKLKPLTWGAKAVMDAFKFSENEGLDHTIGGRLDPETIEKFNNLVEHMVQQSMFGKPHQMTYWAGDFIPTVVRLMKMPLAEPVNKFHMFLNHRELIYASAHILGIPIHFPGHVADSLPSGCSLMAEVYPKGVKLYFWAPSRPSQKLKAEYAQKLKPVQALFSQGTLLPTSAASCEFGQLCHPRKLAQTYVHFVRKTGTYVQICGVPPEETFFAQGEASLNDMEHYVQPVGPLDIDLGTTLEEGELDPGRHAGGAKPVQALAVAASSAATSRSVDVANVILATIVALATMLVAAASGYVGWRVGRRQRLNDIWNGSTPLLVE